MAQIPDRFDLWVRKARECADPARQVDYVLGSLAGLQDWHFLDVGTKEKPQPAEVEIDGERHLLVFSDAGRVDEIAGQGHRPSVITIPTAQAMAWCLDLKEGLLVNPGDYAVAIPLAQLEAFHTEWMQRGAQLASGFWIPNMTTEEEDFWQEHGL